ncbi:MAG: FtsX-like permease family protein, partial [Bryobacteraceae bacterium]|nr:FtsX-like permease family protein [Bryobacteraceae bacterium]
MTGTAFRIAIRDLRASWSKFLFVVLAVAAGVGALTGVRGFSESFRGMLTNEARTLMAADLFVRVFGELSPEQSMALASLEDRGAQITRVTESLTMVASTPVPEPALVTLKAIDPAVYPLYGEVKLDPARRLKDLLRDDSVLISSDLKLRLKAGTGDSVRVGGMPFLVAGIIVAEPDRMSGSFSIGPRMILTRAGLERTGLLGPGSRASQRVLFRLAPGKVNLATAQSDLKRAFPEALIVNYRELNPNVSQGIERATTFLSLVSLIALIVGAIGVATAMHAHLQTRMDSIAVMKSIGARSGQIMRIYLLQTSILGLAGGLLGIVFGMAVQRAFPALLEKFLQVRPEIIFTPSAALQGLALGILTTVLFTLPPLLSVREIRPALVLRRDMPEVRQGFLARLRKSGIGLLTMAVVCAGLAGLAATLVAGSPTDALKIGGTFIGGLLVSLLVLAGTAAVLLRSLRWFAGRTNMPMSLR